jgi:hypothetical protein
VLSVSIGFGGLESIGPSSPGEYPAGPPYPPPVPGAALSGPASFTGRSQGSFVSCGRYSSQN